MREREGERERERDERETRERRERVEREREGGREGGREGEGECESQRAWFIMNYTCTKVQLIRLFVESCPGIVVTLPGQVAMISYDYEAVV